MSWFSRGPYSDPIQTGLKWASLIAAVACFFVAFLAGGPWKWLILGCPVFGWATYKYAQIGRGEWP